MKKRDAPPNLIPVPSQFFADTLETDGYQCGVEVRLRQ
jgi:hypothetical protein